MMKEDDKKYITDSQDKIKECSNVSICVMICNIIISIVYLLAGFLGHSIATLSEGVDSLIDAGSSLLLLIGFKISARKPDYRHPKGHTRIEYIIGLLISEIILFASFSLARQSITNFNKLEVNTVPLFLLIVSVIGVFGKIIIANYISVKNKKLYSTSLKVYYKNTLADLKAIIFVAISAIIQHFTTLPVDAVAGLLLALLIGIDGFKSFFENVSLLIGEEKEEIVLS